MLFALFLLSATSHLKENGSKLVGQCEISHPVARPPSISVLGADEYDADPLSPVDDGLDGAVSPRGNVMFKAQDKGEYQSLAARITSEADLLR